MNDIDKWCAEQCGVKCDAGCFWFDGVESMDICEYEWTIQDPRCREIVRERFEIATELDTVSEAGWWAYCYKESGHILAGESGKTIAEAEIACITAIYEARDG